MNQQGFFGGILHNTSKENPEFHNWNRVRVKYCDGASFTGDVEQVNPENKLYFRGARIFKAIMEDLWNKGMKNAENAILTGTSAGGLATILNCDKFKSLLPESARVKCVANAGFFIDGKTINGTSHIQEMYQEIVNLHGSAKNLPLACTSAMEPSLLSYLLRMPPLGFGAVLAEAAAAETAGEEDGGGGEKRTKIFLLALLVLCITRHVVGAEDDLNVNITIHESATAQGSVCLDGSPPAYHLDRGHGAGLDNWIVLLKNINKKKND
ncbi:hypothetical protein MTR67_036496 [Solanum verrucosum]|uniref:Pectin acetylesterase n=1 Tax=Solanum verrucosum TaxID=315347 RepID=A0AAF0ZL14_SOLVR|nr:hypothetical protein MTR67_036496 [Solanum verrucosum]